MAAAAKMYNNKPPRQMEKKKSLNAVRILNSSAIAKTCQSSRGAISTKTTLQLHMQVNESNAKIIESS